MNKRFNLSGIRLAGNVSKEAQGKIDETFKRLDAFIKDSKTNNPFYLSTVTNITPVKYVLLICISVAALIFYYVFLKKDFMEFMPIIWAFYFVESYSYIGRLSFSLLLIRSIYMVFVSAYTLRYDHMSMDTTRAYDTATEKLKKSGPKYNQSMVNYEGEAGSTEAFDYYMSIFSKLSAVHRQAEKVRRNIAIIFGIAGVFFITVFQYFFLMKLPVNSYVMSNVNILSFNHNIIFLWISLPFTAFVLSVTLGYVISIIPEYESGKKKLLRAAFVSPAIIYSLIVYYFLSDIGIMDMNKLSITYIYLIITAAVFVSLLLTIVCSDFDREKSIYTMRTGNIIHASAGRAEIINVTKTRIWVNVILRCLVMYFALFALAYALSEASGRTPFIIFSIVFSIGASLLLPAFKGRHTSTLECLWGRGKCIAVSIIFFVIAFTEVLALQTIEYTHFQGTADLFFAIFLFTNIVVSLIRMRIFNSENT